MYATYKLVHITQTQAYLKSNERVKI